MSFVIGKRSSIHVPSARKPRPIRSKTSASVLAIYELPVSAPIKIVLSLMKRYGGTGKLAGAGTPANTRPARSNFEPWQGQIGRASCRERVEMGGGGGALGEEWSIDG